MVTRTSSVIAKPPHPSKRFSARNTWIWPSNSARSPPDSRRKNTTWCWTNFSHSFGNGRARRRRRLRCFNNDKITADSNAAREPEKGGFQIAVFWNGAWDCHPLGAAPQFGLAFDHESSYGWLPWTRSQFPAENLHKYWAPARQRLSSGRHFHSQINQSTSRQQVTLCAWARMRILMDLPQARSRRWQTHSVWAAVTPMSITTC